LEDLEMTHIITSLCLRDSGCVDVCPVECIVPGQPVDKWPWYYIDPDTCIDCGACVPECPVEAIYGEEEELPIEYEDGQWMNAVFFAEGPGYGALGDEEVTRW
jgi:ferredoxin